LTNNESLKTDLVDRHGQTTSLIESIWTCFAAAKHGAAINDPSNSQIADIDQCVSMVDVARQHGCEIESSSSQHLPEPNTLFEWRGSLNDNVVDTSVSAAIEGVLAAGLGIEDRNCFGQTVLLYAANRCRHNYQAFLKKLISLGANIHAVDDLGRDVLRQVLKLRIGLLESYKNIFVKSALLPKPFSDEFCIDLDCVSIYPSCVEGTYAYHIRSPCWPDRNNDDPDIDYSLGHESEPFDPYGYGDDNRDSYVGDYDIDDFTIGKGIEDVEAGLPCGRQKTRVRFKLLAFLEAGCDPNLLDKFGDSPSYYAREEDLWPQWEWALTQTGYVYDEDKELWVKDVSFSDIVDFTAAV
jgi:hypothetical protein